MAKETVEAAIDSNGKAPERSRGSAGSASKESRLFTPDFVLATLSNFAYAFSLQMLIATLPVYVINLGGDQVDAGLVSSAIAFTAFLSRPLWGWLTDTRSCRPIVLIGISILGLANLVYLAAASIFALVLGRLVQGFGLSCYTTAANVYVAEITPLRRRAEAIGFFAAAQAVGFVVSPVIGFMIVESAGFRQLFFSTIGLTAVAFIFSAFTGERRRSLKLKPPPWSLRTGIVSINALPAAWMALCMGIGFGPILAFIAIFAQERGIQNPGFYFMAQAAALLVSRLFTGRLADRFGRFTVIVPGVILMVIGLAILPLEGGLPLFIISASLFGLGFGSAQPASMALLFDRIRPEERGVATGTYFTGFDIGFIIGTLFMGVISRHWGYPAMWSISAACTQLTLAGILADRRRGAPGADQQ